MSTTTITEYAGNYSFRCTEDDLKGKCVLVATTEAQLRNAVHDALINSMEHSIIKQNGRFLDDLYYALDEKGIHRRALVKYLKDRFPFDFDTETETFRFKQRKAISILENKGTHVAMPENGKPFDEEHMIRLWDICSTIMDVTSWTDYKQTNNVKKDKPKMTQEQADKKLATLQKQAEEAGVILALPSKATITEMPQAPQYAEYEKEFAALYAILTSSNTDKESVDRKTKALKFLAEICASQATAIVNG